MTEPQQRLYCALALLEESDLKAFFRAIRFHSDSTPEVEVVNEELDRGIRLMDILGPLGPLAAHMEDHVLEIGVVKLQNGRWAIDFGFHGPSGQGNCWTMDICENASITNIVCERFWVPRGAL
jgi:hypothetical protein